MSSFPYPDDSESDPFMVQLYCMDNGETRSKILNLFKSQAHDKEFNDYEMVYQRCLMELPDWKEEIEEFSPKELWEEVQRYILAEEDEE